MGMSPERLQQIEELYHSIREKEPSDREIYLAESCTGDEELRREVESLLAESDSRELLNKPALEILAGVLANPDRLRLAAGRRLGPYEIVELIGEGGMGAVYRANDSRLGRDVAIKVSAERFSESFEREARAIAALNHPNICTLYDVGPNYLVMEFVEGETLAKQIHRGAMPLNEALGIARQIADAIEAAHERRIIHRDLKPGNVIVTPSGLVKVLDFGLAKITPVDPAAAVITGNGAVAGTPAYMSPEQVKGGPIDKRADIWAFGVILYEMLTGRSLFRRPTVADTLVAVSTQDPDWELVPLKARRLLRRCLERDPKRRLRDIGEFPFLIEETPAETARVSRRILPWALAAILALATALLAWAPWRSGLNALLAARGAPLVLIPVDLGSGVSLSADNGPALAISPDATRIVYSSRDAQGKVLLYWRKLDQSSVNALPGTESAFDPFFSPDGKHVAFFADGRLKRVELESGSITDLANAVNPAGGSWGEDGRIVFHRAPTLDLWTVPANGGEVTQIARDPELRAGRYWPQVLPGGQAVLFTRTRLGATGANIGSARIEAMAFKDGRQRVLVEGATFGRYAASGHLLYLRRGTVFARAFDATRLEVTGPEVPVLNGVEYSSYDGAAQFEFSRNGTLVYRASRPGTDLKTVQWMDSDGRLEPLLATPGDYRSLQLSPDGRRLALSIADGKTGDVYVQEIQKGQQPTRLTVDSGMVDSPLIWSRDGRYIFFRVAEDTWWVPSDRASQPKQLVSGFVVSGITTDGTKLMVVTRTPKTRGDAWLLPITEDSSGPRGGQPVPLLNGPSSEAALDSSPDSRWIPYASDETGLPEVYVIASSDPSLKWPISRDSGVATFWSRTSMDLFYCTFFSPVRIMVAPYTVEGGRFRPGQPRPWSQRAIPARAGLGAEIMSVAPDGKRFAVLMPAEESFSNRVVFVTNFFDEIRRRLAEAK
jgi:Tol biopolymer transport system component/predicted Ser/Thr protein kinase